jgi:hypothetical protein
MSGTARDRLHYRDYLVIGVRPGGALVALYEAADLNSATRHAELFRLHLEGYERIVVQRIGSATAGELTPAES